jgi:hypothetical protein
MGPLSHTRSVVDRNDVVRRITITRSVFVCLQCGLLSQCYYPTRHSVSSKKLLAHQAQIDGRAYMLDTVGFIVLT